MTNAAAVAPFPKAATIPANTDAPKPDATKINDLRSALTFLEQCDGELISTDEPVDPVAELCGVYRYVGAHGTVMRPTRLGPAMMFNKVKGYDDVRVVIGVLCRRERVAKLLGTTAKNLGHRLRDAVKTPIAPVTVAADTRLRRILM